MNVSVHYYVSTYCLHELHGDCRLTCKTCQAACLCPCHIAPENARSIWPRVEDVDDE